MHTWLNADSDKGFINNLKSIDGWFLGTVLTLALLGWVMVTSASLPIAQRQLVSPFYYAIHQGIYLLVGFVCGLVVLWFPIARWKPFVPKFLVVTFVLLALVLIPGIGRTVNGSTRWIGMGFFTIQVSELAKLFSISYLASYIMRHQHDLVLSWMGFLRPMMLLCGMSLLLLLEPDFGAVVVIMTTALGMMFLANVPLSRFSVLLVTMVGAMLFLAVAAPYRLIRMTSFLDPWADQFNSGYQLTQSLIAFGQGGWAGVGLGGSVQKLFYLPEAHTDFLFAVLAEELGLVGGLAVLGLYIFLALRGFKIGLAALTRGATFEGYLVYGISLWVSLQAFINMGVNSGILPTKGLTLPLMSKGGSSLIIVCVALALIARVDLENKKKDFL